MKLHLLHLVNVPIFNQLQIEEALLRTHSGNWCILNSGTTPAIVMGISGRPEQLVTADATLPLIRRFSGGGTVVVDEETLFVSFICSNALINAHPNPTTVHHWAEQLYSEALQSPHFALKENDYVFGNKKVGGNAQYFRKERWLHHSTFLWDWNLQHMQQLLHPPRAPVYRQGRSHDAFLCRLSDHLPVRTTFHTRLIATLRDHFTIEVVSPTTVAALTAHPHRRATTFVQR